MISEEDFTGSRFRTVADEAFEYLTHSCCTNHRGEGNNGRLDSPQGWCIAFVLAPLVFLRSEQLGRGTREINSPATHKTRLPGHENRDSSIDSCQFSILITSKDYSTVDDGCKQVGRHPGEYQTACVVVGTTEQEIAANQAFGCVKYVYRGLNRLRFRIWGDPEEMVRKHMDLRPADVCGS
jgi:hypothetical protein